MKRFFVLTLTLVALFPFTQAQTDWLQIAGTGHLSLYDPTGFTPTRGAVGVQIRGQLPTLPVLLVQVDAAREHSFVTERNAFDNTTFCDHVRWSTIVGTGIGVNGLELTRALRPYGNVPDFLTPDLPIGPVLNVGVGVYGHQHDIDKAFKPHLSLFGEAGVEILILPALGIRFSLVKPMGYPMGLRLSAVAHIGSG